MKKTFALLAITFILITPLLALAQTSTNPCTLQGAATSGGADPSQLPRCVNQIYVWSLGIAALLALLMMIIGGYSYMTSAGNAEQATKGVDMLWSSIIGLALLFGAYLLLNTINPDLVKFPITSIDCLDPAKKDTDACKVLIPPTIPGTPAAPRATPTP